MKYFASKMIYIFCWLDFYKIASSFTSGYIFMLLIQKLQCDNC